MNRKELGRPDKSHHSIAFSVDGFLLLFFATYTLVHHSTRTTYLAVSRLWQSIFFSKLNVRLLFNKKTLKRMRRLYMLTNCFNIKTR